MNPFDAHAQSVAQYQRELAQPLVKPSGAGIPGTIIYPIDRAQSQTPESVSVPAVVAPFELRDMFVNGGFSPHLISNVILAKTDCNPAWEFGTGDYLIVIGSDARPRVCKINNVDDTFTNWRIGVEDVNENA